MDVCLYFKLRPTYAKQIWKGEELKIAEDYFNLGEKIFKIFEEYPDIIGQIDAATGEKETFASMGNRIIRCAVWLKKQGIKPGDVVGFCSGNHLDSCIPMFASFYIGSIFNGWWDSCLDEDLVKYFIELTEPKVLFVAEELTDIILKAAKNTVHKLKIIVFGRSSGLDSFKDILNIANAGEIKKFQCTKITNPQQPIIIMYTSGTTSSPKGAVHTYGSLARIGNFESKEISPNNIKLWFSGLSWISGVTAVMHSIFSRSSMVICHGISEEEACNLIEKYKISRMIMGVSVANRLHKTEAAFQRNMSSVIYINYGGGVAKKEMVESMCKIFNNATIYYLYGCTEAGTMTGNRINLNKPTSCGSVLHNAEVMIIKPETGERVGPNEQGEICYRGPSVMSGYWKNAKATKEAIDSQGWYHTGDLGYYDEEGDFFIVERIKELIKYRLYHVPPAVIENVIQDHPGVAEVGVVAKPDNDDLEQPMAFITKLPGAEVTEDEIHELVNNKLHDRFKLRGGICFLNKMPHTSTSKIAKKELRAMAKKLAES